MRQQDLERGQSTSCHCVMPSIWTEESVKKALDVHILKLGRMPTTTELRRGGEESLVAAVVNRGGFRLWSQKLDAPLVGSTTHRGAAWEDHEEALFKSFGWMVERQATKAPFDLLVNQHRVDVKSAAWSDYSRLRGARAGETAGLGYVFGGLLRGERCDFFDLICVEADGSVARRYVIPSSEARVTMLTITKRTLDGYSKYSAFENKVDLLAPG